MFVELENTRNKRRRYCDAGVCHGNERVRSTSKALFKRGEYMKKCQSGVDMQDAYEETYNKLFGNVMGW